MNAFQVAMYDSFSLAIECIHVNTRAIAARDVVRCVAILRLQREDLAQPHGENCNRHALYTPKLTSQVKILSNSELEPS